LNFLISARLDRLSDLEHNQPAVLSTLALRIRIRLTRLVVKTKRLLHEAIRPLPVVVGFLRDLIRSRNQLIAENALLRQQLIVASRKVKRPVFKPHERGLMVLLSRIVRGWRDAVLLVKPETILRWHREGFRLFWKWKARKRKPAGSKISAEQIALIRQMAQENVLWGAEPGSVRRECLDHMIILGRGHLANVLNEYSFRYFNKSRPHQGICQRIPSPMASKKFTAGNTIGSIPILAGLHHDYRVAA
jgi:hypothetical protein